MQYTVRIRNREATFVDILLGSSDMDAVGSVEDVDDRFQQCRMSDAVEEDGGNERFVGYLVSLKVLLEEDFLGRGLRIVIQDLNAMVEELAVRIRIAFHARGMTRVTDTILRSH